MKISEGRSVHVGPILDFVVLGTPVQQGSIRGFGSGRFVHSNSKTLKPWRAEVSDKASEAIGACRDGGGVPPGDVEPTFPLSGPIAVVCEFTVRKPTTAPKTRITWPVARPDLDKYVRGILDSLAAAGVYKDDSQVVSLTGTKTFPDQDRWSLWTPGVRVLVSRIVWMPWEG